MDLIFNMISGTGNIILYYLLPFVVVLGIMIFFHELGHFLIAKLFDVKVEKFALGFGPRIISRVFGETEYSIRYIPLGGFVKMLGEDEYEENPEPLPPEDEIRAFNNKHPIKRIAIVAAGPVFNLVLAFMLFFGVYAISGTYIMATDIGQITPGSAAEKAGLKSGDKVLMVQNKKVEEWEDIKELVQDQAGKPLTFTIKRDNQILEKTITPEASSVKNVFGEEIKSALIGIVAAGEYTRKDLTLLQAVKQGLLDTWKWIKLTLLVVVKLFQGVVSIKTVGGPILIGQVTGQIVQEDVGALIPFMAIISVNLGILNLFPIPILDGGVIIFLILELLLGKPLSLQKREIAQKIGLSLLVFLMLIVFYNDITRLLK